MQDQFTPSFINRLLGHLDNCKDVCDHFGIGTNLVPYLENLKVVGFTAKSYRDPETDSDEPQFEYDPFWDEDDIGDYTGIDEEQDGATFAADAAKYPEIVNKIPADDDRITDVSKAWVSKMMSDMGYVVVFRMWRYDILFACSRSHSTIGLHFQNLPIHIWFGAGRTSYGESLLHC
jgi:hypothetical protein